VNDDVTTDKSVGFANYTADSALFHWFISRRKTCKTLLN